MDYSQTIAEMHRFVADKVVPGVTYGIIDGDQTMTDYFGDQELVPDRILLQPHEFYDLASLTKVVGTTNLILKLLADQRLKLDDSISTYLPQWRSPQTTIRHLLTHTSDIVGYIPHRNELPKAELVPALLNLTSGPDLGHVVHYQDYNFIFLGWIASQILGKPVQTLISEQVLPALDMPNATFHPDDVNQVVPTAILPGKGLLRGVVHDPKTRILKADCGAAGLFSPVEDLLHFSRWLLGQVDYPDFVSRQWVDQLFVDQTPDHLRSRSFGWILRQYHDHHYILHTGYTGTLIVVDRKAQQALVFLSNRVHPDATNQQFFPYRSRLIRTFIQDANRQSE